MPRRPAPPVHVVANPPRYRIGRTADGHIPPIDPRSERQDRPIGIIVSGDGKHVRRVEPHYDRAALDETSSIRAPLGGPDFLKNLEPDHAVPFRLRRQAPLAPSALCVTLL